MLTPINFDGISSKFGTMKNLVSGQRWDIPDSNIPVRIQNFISVNNEFTSKKSLNINNKTNI